MDENQFAEKAQAIRKTLYRTAFAYLGREADALEAVDEAVYKGLVSFKKLRQPEYFNTWLTRILINECKTQLKRRSRFTPLSELPETASAEAFDALPLKEAIASLPKKLKDPLILRYFAGLPTAEAARALDIPQGTAATRIAQAKELLRLRLSDDAAEAEPVIGVTGDSGAPPLHLKRLKEEPANE